MTTAQFYVAVRSIVYKQIIGNAPDAEMMNALVEEIVCKVILCNGVDSLVEAQATEENPFSKEFSEYLATIELLIMKFNVLLKLLKDAIHNYGRVNKVKAKEFDERLRDVVDAYINRSSPIFTNEVLSDFVNNLSDKFIEIMKI